MSESTTPEGDGEAKDSSSPKASNPDDLRTLIYVGFKPDHSFPWGGYHITITGRHKLGVNESVELARKAACVFPLTSNSDSEKRRRIWQLHKENIRSVEKQSDGLYLVFLQSEQLDNFAKKLKLFAQDQLTNVKSDWHISMHSSSETSVLETLDNWIANNSEWGIYVNLWNNATSEAQWFEVQEDVQT